MKLAHTATLFSVISGAALVVFKSCSDAIFEVECVSFYSDFNCQDFIDEYVPTCAGNCFQFSSFNSLGVGGNHCALGTDCHAYSDTNCQDEIVDSGNVVWDACVSTPGAQSMICYYDC